MNRTKFDPGAAERLGQFATLEEAQRFLAQSAPEPERVMFILKETGEPSLDHLQEMVCRGGFHDPEVSREDLAEMAGKAVLVASLATAFGKCRERDAVTAFMVVGGLFVASLIVNGVLFWHLFAGTR